MSQNLTSIRRDSEILAQNVATGTTIGAAGGFAVGAYAGAMLLCVSGSATVQFYVKRNATDANAYVLRSAFGEAISVAMSSGSAYPLPDEAYAAPFILLVATSGSASFQICLKG